MGNQVNTLSFRRKKLKACPGRELSKDRISELPDDVIIYILSLLSMKEAGRTSVLSRRWRYVWAYIPVLNFDAFNILYNLKSKGASLGEENTRFLSWVNQVVGSYQRSAIDEFCIRFDLDMTSEYSIHNWIKFVMEKRVKRLELDFFTGGVHNNKYAFPNVSLCNSLTYLKLACVNITGEALQNFLKICPGLEYLSVKSSQSLVNLEVVGATLSLKYLEILSCGGVKHIEICAPNLVSLSYSGPIINMPLKRSPKLTKLSIGGLYAEYLTNNFLELSSGIFQLEALKLDLFCCRIKRVMKSVDRFPICTRLRELELLVSPDDGEDLFCFATLIKSCPFLRKFVLKLDFCDPVLKRKRLKVEACPHYHLKIVEIVGFVGHATDLEFIMFLVESSVVLEKIVIDPREPMFIGTPWELEEKKRIRTARKQARKLLAKLKPGADLIIL